ncbi:MAG: InlB B-repeat-containing protein [Candidatus Aenigmatarchaeota archaeon]
MKDKTTTSAVRRILLILPIFLIFLPTASAASTSSFEMLINASGFVENNREQAIEGANVTLWSPGDDHYCEIPGISSRSELTDEHGYWEMLDYGEVVSGGDYCYLILTVEEDGHYTNETEVRIETEEQEYEWNRTLEHKSNFEVEIVEPKEGDEFAENEGVEVTYLVENTGDANGTQDIEFFVDGEHQATEEDFTLEEGESEYGTFEWTADTPHGERELSVESYDDSDSVTVAVGLHKLTIQSTDGGEAVEPGEGTFEYKHNETVDIEAVAEDNSDFLYWSGDVGNIEDVESPVTSIVMQDNYTITAEFSKETPELELSSTEGGEVSEPGEGTFQYDHGEVVDIVAEADEGWEFTEWTGDVGNVNDTDSAETNVTMEDNYSITAEFERKEYELGVNVQGQGEELNHGQGLHRIDFGETVELEASPSDGWYFDQWSGYKDSQSKTVSFDMPAKDTNMTASFGEYGVDVTAPEDDEVVKKGRYKYNFTVKNTGDTQDTYNITVSEEGSWLVDTRTITLEPDETRNVTATLEIPGDDITENNTITLNATSQSDDTVSDSDSFNVHFKEYYNVSVEAPVNTTVPEAGNYSYDFLVNNTGNREDTYDLTVSDTEGWNVEAQDSVTVGAWNETWVEVNVTVPEGTKGVTNEINLTAQSNNASDWDSFNVTHKTVEYSFEILQTIGNGTVYVNGSEVEPYYQDEFVHRSVIEVNASPDPGWNFSHWMGDYPEGNQTENIIALEMDGNKTLRGYFENITEDIKHNLTMNVDGEGTTVPEKGVHEYSHGELVILKAMPDECWDFSNWKGGIMDHYTGNESEVTVLMDEDKNITANFTRPSECHRLTIETQGSGTTDPSPGDHYFESDEVATVEATPDSGWEFDKWTGDVDGTGTTIDVAMDSDKSITANFKETDDGDGGSGGGGGGGRPSPIEPVVRPVANAGDDIEGYIFESIAFEGTGSIEEGSIEAYRWDFDGDGTWDYEDTEDGTTTHVYNQSDIYEAVFEVESSEGYTDNDTTKVFVYRTDHGKPKESRRTVIKDMFIDGFMAQYIYDSEENTTSFELNVENNYTSPKIARINVTLPEELSKDIQDIDASPLEYETVNSSLVWEIRLDPGENTTVSFSKPGYISEETFKKIRIRVDMLDVEAPTGFLTRAVSNPVFFALILGIIWIIREILVGNFSTK